MKRQRFYEFEPKNADLPTFVLDVLGHLKQHGRFNNYLSIAYYNECCSNVWCTNIIYAI
jgi:hypothetical protein